MSLLGATFLIYVIVRSDRYATEVVKLEGRAAVRATSSVPIFIPVTERQKQILMQVICMPVTVNKNQGIVKISTRDT
jgi:hypothetical protein